MQYGLFLLSFFVGMYSSSAQQLQSVIAAHYPKADEPGGIAFTAFRGQAEFSPFGRAELNKKTVIGAETAFRMASVSKQFTAMATYLLIKKGALLFDTPIRKILPELPEATASITINQLLQHTSGIWDYEAVIPEGLQHQLSDTDVLQLLVPIDSVYFPAGSTFRYSNTGYCLLAVIVERVSKTDYATFVSNHIFEPTGLKQTQIYTSECIIPNRAYGYHPTATGFLFADQSNTSATKGDGGVYISAQEYTRWMNSNNPLWDKAFWKTVIRHKVPLRDDIYYSMGLFVKMDKKDKIQAVFHSGESTGFHNAVLFQPQEQRTVCLFTNRDDLIINEAYDEILKIYQAKPLNTEEPLFQWLSKVYANEWR
ncbi:serine hydrolase domain-containing protein [Sphingobacterium tabacisoli]